MRQFDNLLRQGLMDANLAQYERVLRQAEAGAPDFTSQYRRERIRLLAAPWAWEKRRGQPMLHRGILRGVAIAVAVLLLVIAAAAASVSLWMAFFGGLDQRQQEIVNDMEISGGEPEKTAAESRLPPPVEHDGVTVTPLSILGAKNRLYMVLEICAPEGTVFHQEDDYWLFGGLSQPVERRTEMTGHTGGFTVLEAGTKEPNVLLGVVEGSASFDIGGCTYQIRALHRRSAPDEEWETVFQASDNTTWAAGTWDIPIPEDLNQNRVLEPVVEGTSMTTDKGTMTLLSMSVSPLGIWWKYRFDSGDMGPGVRIALQMKDGSEIEAAPGQMTMGDMGSGCTATVYFEKPVDLSQAEAVLWGDVEIPLAQPEQAPE